MRDIRWWERIDRVEELDRIQQLTSDSKCIAFTGNEFSGRDQFAALAAERLQRSGVELVSYSPPDRRPSDVKACLLAAWRLVPINYEIDVLPPWAVYADRSPHAIAHRLQQILSHDGRRFCFIFANIEPLSPEELSAFQLLTGPRTGVVLILHETIPAGSLENSPMLLSDFTRGELVEAIERAEGLSHVPAAAAVVRLFEDWPNQLIRPTLAYTVLSDWARQGYPHVWELP